MHSTLNNIDKGFTKFVERIIFNVRWLLNFFYVGLIAALLLYCYTYVKHILHIVIHADELNSENMMMVLLVLVDIVMVANLVKMIITGSYNSFVSKNHGYPNENIGSGVLKVKMSTSIMGVSAIHLLQTFIEPNVDWNVVWKQIAIHGTFIISSLSLAVIDFLHTKGEAIEHEMEKEH